MAASRQQWLECGLELVAVEGVNSLILDNLSVRMGLTKGSFYHHFASMAEYEREMAEFWAQMQISAIPRLPRSPSGRLVALQAYVEQIDTQGGGIESAMQAWAQVDGEIRIAISRVDAARLKFFRSVFEPIVADRGRLSLMVEMLGAMLRGSMVAAQRSSGAHIGRLLAEFIRLYGLEGEAAVDLQARLPI